MLKHPVQTLQHAPPVLRPISPADTTAMLTLLGARAWSAVETTQLCMQAGYSEEKMKLDRLEYLQPHI